MIRMDFLPIAFILHQYVFGILMFLISTFLILLVLVQRGRGGGLTGALGGPGGQSAFGTKAGDIFTRITVVMAGIWIFTCALGVWWMQEAEGPLGSDPIETTLQSDADGIGSNPDSSTPDVSPIAPEPPPAQSPSPAQAPSTDASEKTPAAEVNANEFKPTTTENPSETKPDGEPKPTEPSNNTDAGAGKPPAVENPNKEPTEGSGGN